MNKSLSLEMRLKWTILIVGENSKSSSTMVFENFPIGVPFHELLSTVMRQTNVKSSIYGLIILIK